MKVISLLNHKGGTGKTTSSINIGAELANRGKKVLLLDFDAQANLSQGLGLFDQEQNVYTSLHSGTALPIVNFENFDVVPSSLDLAALETEISSKIAREQILKNAIAKISGKYDYILIDCPPSLGIMTINCLVASDHIIIPLDAEFFAFKGLDTIIDVMNMVNQAFSKSLSIAGVIINKYNGRKKLTQSIEAELKKYLGDALLDAKLRTNISISESQINGQTVFDYAPESNAAEDFKAIVSELLDKQRI